MYSVYGYCNYSTEIYVRRLIKCVSIHVSFFYSGTTTVEIRHYHVSKEYCAPETVQSLVALDTFCFLKYHSLKFHLLSL